MQVGFIYRPNIVTNTYIILLNTMENIFMVGLSFESIKKKIAAQCAWNDTTNLATLPPIVNPMSNADVDGVIWLKIIDFSCRFAGYVSDVEQSDDIVRIVMHADRVPERSRERIYHFIEEFVVCSVLEELYSPQQQAKTIVARNATMVRSVESKLRQMLCLM